MDGESRGEIDPRAAEIRREDERAVAAVEFRDERIDGGSRIVARGQHVLERRENGEVRRRRESGYVDIVVRVHVEPGRGAEEDEQFGEQPVRGVVTGEFPRERDHRVDDQRGPGVVLAQFEAHAPVAVHDVATVDGDAFAPNRLVDHGRVLHDRVVPYAEPEIAARVDDGGGGTDDIESDLSRVGTRRHHEIELEVAAAPVADGVDAPIETAIPNPLDLLDVRPPGGRLVAAEVVTARPQRRLTDHRDLCGSIREAQADRGRHDPRLPVDEFHPTLGDADLAIGEEHRASRATRQEVDGIVGAAGVRLEDQRDREACGTAAVDGTSGVGSHARRAECEQPGPQDGRESRASKSGHRSSPVAGTTTGEILCGVARRRLALTRISDGSGTDAAQRTASRSADPRVRSGRRRSRPPRRSARQDDRRVVRQSSAPRLGCP